MPDKITQTPRLSQGHIIDRLNAYLKWNLVPSAFRLDKGGVCKGLSLVYGKYVLEGKEKEFIDLLNLTSSIEAHADSEPRVMQFIIEILKAYAPSMFTNDLEQFRSDEAITVDSKPLHTKESIALVTDENTWTEIFETINVRPDEVVFLSSPNHAITIKKTGDEYTVYDPNYSAGPKNFPSAADVIKELKQNVFRYEGDLALRLKVMSTDPLPRPRISPQVLYSAMDNPNAEATSYGRASNTLMLATKNNDKEAIEALIATAQEKGCALEEVMEAASLATTANNTAALRALLPLLSDENMNTLLVAALASGKKDSYNLLLEQQSTYAEMLTYDTEKIVGALIGPAARGSNHELLSDLFIKAAIASQDITNIQSLLPSLTATGKLDLAFHAIKVGYQPGLEKTLDYFDVQSKKKLALHSIEIGNLDALKILMSSFDKDTQYQLAEHAIASDRISQTRLLLTELNIEQQTKLLDKAIETEMHYAVRSFFPEHLDTDNTKSLVELGKQIEPNAIFPTLISHLSEERKLLLATLAIKDNNPSALSLLLPQLAKNEQGKPEQLVQLAQVAASNNWSPTMLQHLVPMLSEAEQKELIIYSIKEYASSDILRYLLDFSSPADKEELERIATEIDNEEALAIIAKTSETEEEPVAYTELPMDLTELDADVESTEIDKGPRLGLFSSMILKPNKDGTTVLSSAIKHAQYTTSLEVMLTLLDKENTKLSSSQQLHYLKEAINTNNPSVVNTLIGNNCERISKELLACVKISYSGMQTINIQTLELLKEKGVPFTKEMNRHLEKQNLIEKSMAMPFGIKLQSFLYFIKNMFSSSIKDVFELDKKKVDSLDPQEKMDLFKESMAQLRCCGNPTTEKHDEKDMMETALHIESMPPH